MPDLVLSPMIILSASQENICGLHLKLRHENYLDRIHGKSTWPYQKSNMKTLFILHLVLFTVTTQWEPVGLITNWEMNGCSSHNLKPFLLCKVTDNDVSMVTALFCHPPAHVQTHEMPQE